MRIPAVFAFLALSALVAAGEEAPQRSLEDLLKLIKDPERKVRATALLEIKKLPGDAVKPYLKAWVRGKNYHLRILAVILLSETRDEAWIPTYMRIIRDAEIPVIRRFYTVEERPDERVHLAWPEDWLREEAADAIVMVGSRKAFESLWSLKDTHPRLFANVDLPVFSENQKLVPSIWENPRAAAQKDWAACWLLAGRKPDPAAVELITRRFLADRFTRRIPPAYWKHCGPRGWPVFWKLLKAEERKDLLHQAARGFLKDQMDDANARRLVRFGQSDASAGGVVVPTRQILERILVDAPRAPAIKYFANHLDSEVIDIRVKFAEVLGAFAFPETAVHLEKVIRSDKSLRVREAAAESLKRVRQALAAQAAEEPSPGPSGVRLKDGTFLRGDVVLRTEKDVLLKTPDGKLKKVPLSDLAPEEQAPPPEKKAPPAPDTGADEAQGE